MAGDVCPGDWVGGSSAAGVILASSVAGSLWRRSTTELAAQTSLGSERNAKPLARSDFIRRIRLTGLTEATRFHVVTTPLLEGSGQGNLVIIKLVPAGAQVKAGEVLVEFDRQTQEKAALDKTRRIR